MEGMTAVVVVQELVATLQELVAVVAVAYVHQCS